MALRSLAAGLVIFAVGCGSSAPSPGSGPPPPTTPACVVDADCGVPNACTTDACVAGYCQYAYLDTTAYAILSGSPTGALVQAPIPTASYTGTGYAATVCPNGSDPTATPPVCVLEADFGAATLAFDALPGWHYQITGTVPLRAQRIPVTGTVLLSPFSGDLTVTGNGGCPGGVETFSPQSLTLAFSEDPVHGLALTISATVDPAAMGAAVTACGSSVLSSLLASTLPLVQSSLAAGAERQIIAAVSPQLCLTTPCPAWAVDDAGICRVSAGGACMARGVDPGTDLLIIPACGL